MKNVLTYLILAFVAIAQAIAAQYDIPSARVIDWTGVGVRGGIPTRSTLLDVTLTPYFAAGSIATTTGSITSGLASLTVADASTFAVGNNVRVWRPEVVEFTVTGGPSATEYTRIYIGGTLDGQSQLQGIPILFTSGASTADTAATIRAVGAAFPGWELSGSGSTVIFTSRRAGNHTAGSYIEINNAGIAGTFSVTQEGAVAVNAASITVKAGSVLTLSANATDTASSWVVSHDDQPAIQAAINAATTSGDVVYMPAGDYRIDSPLAITTDQDNRSLRGASMATTTIHYFGKTGQNGINVGGGPDYEWSNPSVDNTITAGQTKGSTVITIADTTPFVLNRIFNIKAENRTDNTQITAGAVPVITVNGYPGLRQQWGIVTEVISGTQLRISPGLYDDYADLAVDVHIASAQLNGVGIEYFTLNGLHGSMYKGIDMQQCVDSWVQNVAVRGSANFGIAIAYSVFCEIRKCDIRDRQGFGSNGGGFIPGASSACLFEDNIIKGFFPNIEVNSSSSGNVFAYNFCYFPVSFNNGGIDILSNHSAHNHYNLYEGNVGKMLMSDGYFGSASEDTLFRNWLTGTGAVGDADTFSLQLCRFTRNYNVVANMFGKTGSSHTGLSFGEANAFSSEGAFGDVQPTDGTFWGEWKLTGEVTTRDSDSVGVLTLNRIGFDTDAQVVTGTWNNFANRLTFVSGTTGTVTIPVTLTSGTLPALNTVMDLWTGSGGYQEQDLDVLGSTILKGNWYQNAAHIQGTEIATGTDTYANSLFRASKPAWFGNRPWPAFSPDSHTEDFESIPAGYRYINGNEGYLGGSVPTAPSTLSATAISSTQINLTWADNSGDETSFRLERRIGAGAWGTVTSPAANATSYSNTGLTPSTTYEYRIYAVNGVGDSTVSNSSSATTSGGGGSPANATIENFNVGTLIIQ